MRLGQDEIERIAERTSNLVVKKLTSSLDFSLPQAELTAEKVLQRMQPQSQINQIAQEMDRKGYPQGEWVGTTLHEMIHNCDCRTEFHGPGHCHVDERYMKEVLAAQCALECVDRGYSSGWLKHVPKGCSCKDLW